MMLRICTIVIITVVLLPALVMGQLKWADHPENPAFIIDGLEIWDCFVLEVNDTLKMWYSAASLGIHYAWSIDDGRTWIDYADNPVLPTGPPGSWESEWLDLPRVIYDGTSYYMWYMGEEASGFAKGGLATSMNGIDWTKHIGNPILNPGPEGTWDEGEAIFGAVIHDGTQYVALYAGGVDNGASVRWSTGRATSLDGIEWEKDPNPVMTWENGAIFATSLLLSDGGYEAFYTYALTNNQGWKFGYATSGDGIVWDQNYPTQLLMKSGLYIACVSKSEDAPIYRIWYGYRDGRCIDYAESLKGFEAFEILHAYLSPGMESQTFNMTYFGDDTDLTFHAVVYGSDNTQIAAVELFDDGAHEDGVAGDGLYGGGFSPNSEDIFEADFEVHLNGDSLITYADQGRFTNAGPVVFDSITTDSDDWPNPGEFYGFTCALLNQSEVYEFTNVSARLVCDEDWITVVTQDADFGSILPGETAEMQGGDFFGINIADTNLVEPITVPLTIKISEGYSHFWTDSLNLSLTIHPVGIDKGEEQYPKQYRLYQNFPNPFNPMTRITYSVPEESKVRMVIYDIMGYEVVELFSGERLIGNYETTWYGLDNHGRQVSTGVYFARLEAGRHVDVIKMLYLK